MKSATKKKTAPAARKITKPFAKKFGKLSLVTVAGTTLVPFPLRPEFTVGSDTFAEKFTGLTWTKDAKQFSTFAEAEAAAKACRAGGFDDWQLPERHELLTLVDLDNHGPATYPELKALTPTNDWYYTKTPAAWNKEAGVWVVSFYLGDVGSYHRYYSGLARFVRRPGQ